MEHKEILLRVENLCQHFGPVKAVDDVSFDIHKAEVFSLVGESGSGKTTIGRCITKIYDITSGNVYFQGRRICAGTKSYTDQIAQCRKKLRQEPALRQEYKAKIARLRAQLRKAKQDHTGIVTDIQMIFQDPVASLNPRMTVGEIIAEGLVIRGLRDKKQLQAKVCEVMATVGLVPEQAHRYPHEFSGGQRQRIGIARSLIMHPRLLIADEPVSALDVSIQAQVINLLNDLRKSLELTVLFIAHDLSVVKYFSDRIGVMYLGKLVELATAEELFAHPLHPYTKSLLSAIPIPDPHREKQRVRIPYDGSVHDYSQDKPSMRLLAPGHFVYCNGAEEKRYLAELQE